MDSPNNGKALAHYGDRDAVREMADRIKRMLPGGSKMSDNDALGLAQVGLAHDLDPFNKEVWLIFNEETGKSYGIMVGIQGWRKHAHKQTDYWGVGGSNGFHHITDPEAIKNHGANPNDIVYEYHITDVASIDSWSSSVKRVRDATGLTFNEVEKMIGQMPVSVGIGIFSPGERTKMKPHQAAMYRAERDCLRRRFQVKFGLVAGLPDVATEPDEEPDAIIDAIAADIEDKADRQEQLLAEMGYTPEQKTQLNDPAIPTELAHLANICNDDGTPYPLIPTDKLSFMFNSLGKSLKDNGLSPEVKHEKTVKRDAAQFIIAWRASRPAA